MTTTLEQLRLALGGDDPEGSTVEIPAGIKRLQDAWKRATPNERDIFKDYTVALWRPSPEEVAAKRFGFTGAYELATIAWRSAERQREIAGRGEDMAMTATSELPRLWYFSAGYDGDDPEWGEAELVKVTAKRVTARLGSRDLYTLSRTELEQTGETYASKARRTVYTDAGREKLEAIRAERQHKMMAAVRDPIAAG